MQKIMTITSKLIETINGLGIIRSVGKKTFDGAPYGQRLVFYDVCLDNGSGDTIDSFKTLREARKYAKEIG